MGVPAACPNRGPWRTGSRRSSCCETSTRREESRSRARVPRMKAAAGGGPSNGPPIRRHSALSGLLVHPYDVSVGRRTQTKEGDR